MKCSRLAQQKNRWPSLGSFQSIQLHETAQRLNDMAHTNPIFIIYFDYHFLHISIRSCIVWVTFSCQWMHLKYLRIERETWAISPNHWMWLDDDFGRIFLFVCRFHNLLFFFHRSFLRWMCLPEQSDINHKPYERVLSNICIFVLFAIVLSTFCFQPINKLPWNVPLYFWSQSNTWSWHMWNGNRRGGGGGRMNQSLLFTIARISELIYYFRLTIPDRKCIHTHNKQQLHQNLPWHTSSGCVVLCFVFHSSRCALVVCSV